MHVDFEDAAAVTGVVLWMMMVILKHQGEASAKDCKIFINPIHTSRTCFVTFSCIDL